MPNSQPQQQPPRQQQSQSQQPPPPQLQQQLQIHTPTTTISTTAEATLNALLGTTDFADDLLAWATLPINFQATNHAAAGVSASANAKSSTAVAATPSFVWPPTATAALPSSLPSLTSLLSTAATNSANNGSAALPFIPNLMDQLSQQQRQQQQPGVGGSDGVFSTTATGSNGVPTNQSQPQSFAESALSASLLPTNHATAMAALTKREMPELLRRLHSERAAVMAEIGQQNQGSAIMSSAVASSSSPSPLPISKSESLSQLHHGPNSTIGGVVDVKQLLLKNNDAEKGNDGEQSLVASRKRSIDRTLEHSDESNSRDAITRVTNSRNNGKRNNRNSGTSRPLQHSTKTANSDLMTIDVSSGDISDATGSDSFTTTGKTREDDRRRRNTAASARFRQRKKQREQETAQDAKEQRDRADRLQMRVSELEKEVELLRELIDVKRPRTASAATTITDSVTLTARVSELSRNGNHRREFGGNDNSKPVAANSIPRILPAPSTASTATDSSATNSPT